MPKSQTIAKRLLRKNRGTSKTPGIPWRVIAFDLFLDSGILMPFGSVDRFAHTGVPPLNPEYQIALGLKRKPQPPRVYTLPEQAGRMPRLLDRLRKRIAPMMKQNITLLDTQSGSPTSPPTTPTPNADA